MAGEALFMITDNNLQQALISLENFEIHKITASCFLRFPRPGDSAAPFIFRIFVPFQ